ncbi:MAG: site-2 protease family protein [Polyangiaceae bacterium]|nr:site-2 protease family protein [Polyangiaceae bacterium]
MRTSWKMGRVLGIDIFIHATFVLLLGWVAITTYLRQRNLHAMAAGVLFTLVIFASVLLHEMGHALTARRFGIKTRDITLLPIGGVARLERMPEKPGQELLVALAGPAVNVAIALGILAVLLASGNPLLLGEPELGGVAPFFSRLLWVNLSLAIFNLIPAFPMDGGRALRALLAYGGDYVQATRIAAKLGKGIALVFGILGLLYNPILAFIALFVWIGASSEAAGVEAKATLHSFPIQAAMRTDVRVLSTENTLETAARFLLSGTQANFPVLSEGGKLVGVLTRTNLVRGLSESGPEATVASAMDRDFAVAHPAEMLDVAVSRLGERTCRSIPIVTDAGIAEGRDVIVGMLTTDDIGELLMVREALARGPGRALAAT